jgi:RNA polymerase sigma factor (sigma-70 family)
MSPFLSDALLRTQSDERLAALAAAGRGRAFEILVERHRRSLLVFARHAVGAGRAEDVVQQALLQAWRSLQAGAEVEHVRGWLHQIVRHAAWRVARAAADERLPEGLVGSAGPQDEVERRMEVSAVVASLAAMPERQRAAIVQTVLEGHSQREVAASLGLSEGAVRQLVHRGRSFLRATATAVVPMPLANWAASLGSGAGVPVTTRIAEGVAGAGSAGVIGLLAKGGAALVAAGAVATGVATQAINHHHHASPPAHPAGEARAPVSLIAATGGGSEAERRSDGGRDDGSGRGRRRGRRGDDGGHHGRGSGPSGSRHHPFGEDRSGSGRSGSGSGSGDGSGSGSGDGRSGSGDDRSTSGSGSASGDGSRSGSGDDRSTTGSGDDRSGSGESGSADEHPISVSGSGSSGSGDVPSTSGSGDDGSLSGSGDAPSTSGSGDDGSGSGSELSGSGSSGSGGTGSG